MNRFGMYTATAEALNPVRKLLAPTRKTLATGQRRSSRSKSRRSSRVARRGAEGPAIQRPSAASAVAICKALEENDLLHGAETQSCAAAPEFSAVEATIRVGPRHMMVNLSGPSSINSVFSKSRAYERRRDIPDVSGSS